MNPEQLVTALATGDEAAWRHFLDRYGRLIHAVARKYGLEEDDQADVFQNACIAVHRSIGSLKNPESLGSWVYGIAYRLAVDIHRKRRREPLLDPIEDRDRLEEATDASAAPDEEAATLEETALLMDGLARIDERCRRLLEAIYLSTPPLSYAEISASQGMPLGSIGPTRARCLKKLERVLGPVFDGRGDPTIQ